MGSTERLRSCLKLSSTPNLCQHRLAPPTARNFQAYTFASTALPSFLLFDTLSNRHRPFSYAEVFSGTHNTFAVPHFFQDR